MKCEYQAGKMKKIFTNPKGRLWHSFVANPQFLLGTTMLEQRPRAVIRTPYKMAFTHEITCCQFKTSLTTYSYSNQIISQGNRQWY